MKISSIIFDLGGVLIDWNPDYVFDKMFSDHEKKKHFFENICTPDWNEKQDAGRSLKEATDELLVKHPEWTEYIEAYYGRWEEMLGGPIHESVEIFRELKDSGKFKIYALTNWSAETFPVALKLYDFLHWFDGRVVSGEEKMRKPFAEFYKLILERFQLNPSETLFIDDSLRNITGAREAGIHTIAFTSPKQLREDLKKLGLIDA
jgi:2-haloacid dehalogenase